MRELATRYVTIYNPIEGATICRLSKDVPGDIYYMETKLYDAMIAEAQDPIEYIKTCLDELAHKWTQQFSEMCRVARHYTGEWIITNMELAAELDEYWSHSDARELHFPGM